VRFPYEEVLYQVSSVWALTLLQVIINGNRSVICEVEFQLLSSVVPAKTRLLCNTSHSARPAGHYVGSTFRPPKAPAFRTRVYACHCRPVSTNACHYSVWALSACAYTCPVLSAQSACSGSRRSSAARNKKCQFWSLSTTVP